MKFISRFWDLGLWDRPGRDRGAGARGQMPQPVGPAQDSSPTGLPPPIQTLLLSPGLSPAPHVLQPLSPNSSLLMFSQPLSPPPSQPLLLSGLSVKFLGKNSDLIMLFFCWSSPPTVPNTCLAFKAPTVQPLPTFPASFPCFPHPASPFPECPPPHTHTPSLCIG